MSTTVNKMGVDTEQAVVARWTSSEPRPKFLFCAASLLHLLLDCCGATPRP